jgi:hypothetical protein
MQQMSSRSLVLSSLFFAVAWTAVMWWWTAPVSTVDLVILIVSGAITGLLWYWMFGWWMRRYGRHTGQ